MLKGFGDDVAEFLFEVFRKESVFDTDGDFTIIGRD